MTTHPCPAKGCSQPVPMGRLMCPADWRLVPNPLQRAVYTAWARGAGTGSPAHQAAMDTAIRTVDAKREGRLIRER